MTATSAVDTPPDTAAPRRRPRRWIGLLVVVAMAAYVGVQLARPLPAASIAVVAPAGTVIPGAPPAPDWPAAGQAAVGLPGSVLATPGTSVPIGSVAKVMTALLVLRDHPTGPDQPGPQITVSAGDVADYRGRVPSGQSVLPVVQGEVLTERQALDALLVPSANNIADLLAEWDAGGIAPFVARMNAEAASLGLHHTHYTDPSGLDPATVSTASDQLALARVAMADPTFAAVVAQPSVDLPVAGVMHNYNPLLGRPGVVGVKTGSTDQAGGNLVFAATTGPGGQLLIGCVLGQAVGRDPTTALEVTGRSAGALLASVSGSARTVTVASSSAPSLRVVEPWGATVPATVTVPVVITAWSGTRAVIDWRPRRVVGAQPAGSVVATGTLAGTGTVQAVLSEAVAGPSVWWRLTRLG